MTLLRSLPILLLLAPTVSFGQGRTPRQIVERSRRALVWVDAKAGDDPISHFRGFFYEDGATVVTSSLAALFVTSIVVHDARGEVWRPIAVVTGGAGGFAVLRLERNTGNPFIAAAPSGKLRVGDRVVVGGDSKKTSSTVYTGKVKALRRWRRFPIVQTTLTRIVGSEGMPVLDTQGRAIGVAGMLYDVPVEKDCIVSAQMVRAVAHSRQLVPIDEWYRKARQMNAEIEADLAPKATQPNEDETLAVRERAELYEALLIALTRWDVAVGETADLSSESALPGITRRGEAFLQILNEAPRFDDASRHPGVRDSDANREALTEALRALEPLARARLVAEANYVREGGTQASTQREDEARDALMRALVKVLVTMQRPSWANGTAMARIVSAPTWGVPLLNSFRATPDFESADPTVDYAFPKSSLKARDRITGIRLVGGKTFTAVDGWEDVKAFYLKVDTSRGLEIRIVRDGVEQIVRRE